MIQFNSHFLTCSRLNITHANYEASTKTNSNVNIFDMFNSAQHCTSLPVITDNYRLLVVFLQLNWLLLVYQPVPIILLLLLLLLSSSPLYSVFTRMSLKQNMSLVDTLLQLHFRFTVNTLYGAYLPRSYVGSDGLLRQHFPQNVCSA